MLIPANTVLCAVSMGDPAIKLFKLVGGQVSFAETLTLPVSTPLYLHPFDLTIMDLDLDNNGIDESCLIVPMYSDNSNAGTIYIYNLENGDWHTNCLDWGSSVPSNEVVHVLQYTAGHSDQYLIASGGDILVSSFDNSNPRNPKFAVNRTVVFGDCYYAASSHSVPSRAYETVLLNSYNQSSSQQVITSLHVGGMSLWDPQASVDCLLGWMRVGEQGWYDSSIYQGDTKMVNSYMGDMHRVAVLNDEENKPALAFCANSGMGFIVYDISDPEEIKYVWQWDNDTSFWDGSVGGNFNWFGSGRGTPAPPYDPATNILPGHVFGIAINQNSTDQLIHLFIGDGADGLRAFNFSNFFSPFENCYIEDNVFRNFSVYANITMTSVSGSPMLAEDVRTYEDTATGEVYVFTTWKDRHGEVTDQNGRIALTVHKDVVTQIQPPSISSSAAINEQLNVLSIGSPSSNPITESASFRLESSTGGASLAIFDLSGRQVYSFQPQFQNGSATHVWVLDDGNGEVVPNGTYFARLSNSAGRTATTRLTVAR